MSLYRFKEACFLRIWGGSKLRSLFGKAIPSERTGELWLISDHPVHESVVIDGPHEGQTLHQLIEQAPREILGTRPRLTIHGRFPLLLKILDAADVLSVQVHPDDRCAEMLDEPDPGKTEMWHILYADPGSRIICGMDPGVTPEQFMNALRNHAIDKLLLQIPVQPGDSILIRAGTVHALGPGIVLAEIQQNSDLTYRIYDWNRLDEHGRARQLHLEKAIKAIHFGAPPPKTLPRLELDAADAQRAFLAACPYFAAETVTLNGMYRRMINGETFHILLAKSGLVNFNDARSALRLFPGQALLVPGNLAFYEASGQGEFIDYYVPDIEKDVVVPLLNAGYSPNLLRDAGLHR